MFGLGKNKNNKINMSVKLSELMHSAEKNLPGKLDLVYDENDIQYTPHCYSSDFFYFREFMAHWHRYDCLSPHRLICIDGEWKISAESTLFGHGKGNLMPLEDYLYKVLPGLANEWQDLYRKESQLYSLHLPTVEYKPQTDEIWYEFDDIPIKELYLFSCGAGPEYQEYVKRVLANCILRGKAKDSAYNLAGNEKTTLWAEETYMSHAAEIDADLKKIHETLVESVKEKNKKDQETRKFNTALHAFIKQAETQAMLSVES